MAAQRPSSPAEVKARQDLTEWAIPVRFLTPSFGGGVLSHTGGLPHLKPFDPITPVRSASIRGHLRFWWRAVHGAWMFDCLESMKKAETEVWGGPSHHGLVSLTVKCHGRPNQSEAIFWRDVSPQGGVRFKPLPGKSALAYGAFPLSPSNEDAKARDSIAGVVTTLPSFTLIVRFQDNARIEDELIRTIQAWLTFGGVSGRWRRGFGAVDSSDTNWSSRLTTSDALLPPRPRREAPLGGTVAFDSDPAYMAVRQAKPGHGWDTGLSILQRFRQGADCGRNPGQGSRPGRSRWPEPDALRRMTRNAATNHERALLTQNKFPRAAFGLPIVFHFKDRGDPQGQVLHRSATSERFPSPVVLRPGPKDQCILLVFRTQRPDSAWLNGSNRIVETSLSSEDIVEMQRNWPDNARHLTAQLSPLGATLQSFMNFFTASTNPPKDAP